jgi:hypothetical protein
LQAIRNNKKSSKPNIHPFWCEALIPSPYHPSGVINLNGFDQDSTHDRRFLEHGALSN